MKIWKAILIGFCAMVSAAVAAEEVTLSGVVRDISEQPVAGILIRFESAGQSATTRSGEDGSYAVDVELTGEPWFINLDEVELIALGYFCFPGFVWDPDGETEIPELTTVPLRPELTFERSDSGVSCVRLNFDWVPGLTPSVLREYRIERSENMKDWVEVMTISLACPPIEFFDETVPGEKTCHYRAVQGTSFDLSTIDPADLEFVADPTIGGLPGNLVFLAGEPLPDLPVVAPEIRLVNP